MTKNNYIEYPYFGDSVITKKACINCEKDTILKCINLQMKLDSAKYYIDWLKQSNNIAQQLNQMLREENEQLRTKLNNNIEME